MEANVGFSPAQEARKEDDFEVFIETLPKANIPGIVKPLAQYKGFWFTEYYLKGFRTFHQHFQAKESDIILASTPKSGTTWLKSLTFTILNRDKFSISEHPLLSSNPHRLVRCLELDLYDYGLIDHDAINSMAHPRLLATHAPYQLLPSTILEAGCRIIYVCRNPLDTFTSAFHFFKQIGVLVPPPIQSNICVDEIFGKFCDGIFPYGPFWDHALGYWEASLGDDSKVLFLKYEDMLKDTKSCVAKIAQFLGCGFSAEELSAGLVEEITKLCELQNLKNLECNKKGEIVKNPIGQIINNSVFFRKGGVGDWVNILHPSVAERIEKIIQDKFGKSGLSFDIK